MLKKIYPWFIVLILTVTVLAGCKTNEVTGIKLVPSYANLIANIQVSKIINDKDFIETYDKSEKEPELPQTAEEGLDMLFRDMGIDLLTVSEAVVFANTTALERTEYMGFIVEGNFDKEQIITNIKQKMDGNFTTTDYKGYQLYTTYEEDFSITFLSDNILLLGTPKAIKDVISVKKGDVDGINGIILDTYNGLQGDTLIKVASALPKETTSTLAEAIDPVEIPISLEPLANIDIVGFALGKEGETMSFKINTHFTSLESVEAAKDIISGAASLIKGMLGTPAMNELLDNIAVIISDSELIISFKITIPQIEELIENLQ
jgi:hypothetical protein